MIDDEPKIRRGLSNFIAAQKPEWMHPGCAATAEEALDDPLFWETDLLFLDISLPNMNGLELLEIIRDKKCKMEVIIISGYAEFSFAQKALSLQVQEYLLKPIDIQKVCDILHVAEIRYNEALHEHNTKIMLQQNLHLLREQFFANVLFGTEPFNEECYNEKLQKLDLPDSPFVIIQYTYKNPIEDYTDSACEVRQLLREKLQFLLPRENNLFTIFLKTGVVSILLSSDKCLNQILEVYQGNLNNRKYWICCSFIHESLSDLLIAYRESCDITKPVEKVIQDLPFTDQTSYVDLLMDRQAQFHPYVQQAMEYIARNYRTSLNLTVVASQVHLHTSYLSELFKKETGTNLCNYIIDYRICEAKKALCSGNEKVSCIADNVGFNDYHYFSQVFSKRVGISPKRYRIIHHQKHE